VTAGAAASGRRARALWIAAWSGPVFLLWLFAGPVRADGVDDFWYWFEHEHEALLAAETRADREEALGYWLGRIDPGLSYALDTSGRRKVLTLSADGDVNLFRRVELMVEAAPKVKGWKYVAFRQKARKLTPVAVDPVVLDPATTHFDLYRDTGKIGVVLYIPAFDPDQKEAYRVAAMRLMSQAVGEWDVGIEIGFVDFDNQQVRDMQFSRPFAEFAGVFRKLRK
jgi:hypothetical protein